MKAARSKTFQLYCYQARVTQELAKVLEPLLPAVSKQSVRVCGVRSNRLMIQLAHSAMLFQMQGLRSVLLSAARSVCHQVSDIEFIVRPFSAVYSGPEQDYASRQARNVQQRMSPSAYQQLYALSQRCSSVSLKRSLEKILLRYEKE